jgi:calcium-dependent protein kinase
LFSTKDVDSDLKLIDFGLSKHFKEGVPLCEKVGTPYTVAPEILKGTYDEKCDMWCKWSLYLWKGVKSR